jgi:hypothetical protein
MAKIGPGFRIDHVRGIGYSCPMTEAPSPNPSPRPGSGVPRSIKGIAFLSFALSVSVVLLIHHYLTTWKCPIPQ